MSYHHQTSTISPFSQRRNANPPTTKASGLRSWSPTRSQHYQLSTFAESDSEGEESDDDWWSPCNGASTAATSTERIDLLAHATNDDQRCQTQLATTKATQNQVALETEAELITSDESSAQLGRLLLTLPQEIYDMCVGIESNQTIHVDSNYCQPWQLRINSATRREAARRYYLTNTFHIHEDMVSRWWLKLSTEHMLMIRRFVIIDRDGKAKFQEKEEEEGDEG